MSGVRVLGPKFLVHGSKFVDVGFRIVNQNLKSEIYFLLFFSVGTITQRVTEQFLSVERFLISVVFCVIFLKARPSRLPDRKSEIEYLLSAKPPV